MDRFNALGRGTQVMLVAGVLLFVSLFFTWQDIQGAGVVEFNGWRGFLGVLLGLLTIVLIAWIVVRIVAPDVLRLPFSHALASAVICGAIVFFALLKLLSIIDDDATVWAYVGFILAVLVGVGAWMVVQGAGGMQTLRSEIPSMQTAPPIHEPPPGTTTPPAAPSEAAPPPPAEPAPPPPAEPAPPATEPEPERQPWPPTEPEPEEPDRPRDV
jgi:hypothetical protein